MHQAANAVDTTIVLPTCNRAHLLLACLESLDAQSLPPGARGPRTFEIVVVNDGSTDSTPAVLADFARTSRHRIVTVQGNSAGVAAARNLGALHASGTWLACFDDDQITEPGWLLALRNCADATGATCVGGAISLRPSGTPAFTLGPRTRTVLAEHLFSPVATPYRGSAFPGSGSVLIRRDVFFAHGGFDTRFTEGSEDTDLFERLRATGHTAWYTPASRCAHCVPVSRTEPGNLRWSACRIGAGIARVHSRRYHPLRTLTFAAQRLLQAMLRDLPRLAVASICGNRTAEFDVLSSLWFTQGYVRTLPALYAPSWLPTGPSRFLSSLNFRLQNGQRVTG